MKQTYTSATEAMKVAFHLSELLRRPVYRSISVTRHGAPLWVVSLENSSYNSTQELTT